MSADNWAQCPRCLRKHQTELDEARAALDAAYGNVPVAEFDTMRETLAKREQGGIDNTFREDYEFYGVEEGTLHISYSGGCNVCGLSLKVNEERPLDV